MRPGRVLAALLSVASVLPIAAPATDPIQPCDNFKTGRRAPATGVRDEEAGDVRVFAIQYRQEIRYAESYESFARKMRCLVEEYVKPNKSDTIPNIVVFNEDIGLATLGIGTRGLAARTIAAGPLKDPANLTGAIAAFASVGVAYAPQIAYYALAEPDTSPQRLILAAATDTMVRAFMQTFSDIAREFGVYVVASNNQAEFREVDIFDRPEAAVLIDPDLARAYATLQRSTVYEAIDNAGPGRGEDDRSDFDDTPGSDAAGINVHNKAFMWSPNPGVEPYAKKHFETFALGGVMTKADPRSNLVAVNKKTPVTQIEKTLLTITDDGDISAENVGPFPRPGLNSPTHPLPDRTKIGFGISLPAFQWGSALNEPASCTDRTTWMRCIDEAGVNLFLQPEANPSPWASYHDAARWEPPAFQALSWHDSAWRSVADTSVENIRYAVTPFMVGNLVDLAFDGQSGIFERCLPLEGGGDTCDGNIEATHVGLEEWIQCPRPNNHCDDVILKPYAGVKRETIVLAGWVMSSDPDLDVWQNREAFVARSQAMLAGSGSDFENDYLETAIWADLDLD